MASNIKLLGCQLNTIDPETLIYFQQLGITDIQYNTPDIPGEKTWAFEDIKAYKEKTESYGVKLVCIENVPIRFYDKVMLGLPGRDEQIENYIGLIRISDIILLRPSCGAPPMRRKPEEGRGFPLIMMRRRDGTETAWLTPPGWTWRFPILKICGRTMNIL